MILLPEALRATPENLISGQRERLISQNALANIFLIKRSIKSTLKKSIIEQSQEEEEEEEVVVVVVVVVEGGVLAAQELDRRAQILDAALKEFSTKGFKGATIKSIARQARLQSPALIYWYFPDKEALFREVLESQVPLLGAVRNPEGLMERPPEEVLPMIGRRYLSTFDDPFGQRMARLMVGEVVRSPEIVEIFGNALIKRVLGFLKSYMARQIELGRLREHDVRSSSRAFIGMLIPQVGGKMFFAAIREDGLTDQQHVENATRIFLEGLRPER